VIKLNTIRRFGGAVFKMIHKYFLKDATCESDHDSDLLFTNYGVNDIRQAL